MLRPAKVLTLLQTEAERAPEQQRDELLHDLNILRSYYCVRAVLELVTASPQPTETQANEAAEFIFQWVTNMSQLPEMVCNGLFYCKSRMNRSYALVCWLSIA
jgi:hypothetical protein